LTETAAKPVYVTCRVAARQETAGKQHASNSLSVFCHRRAPRGLHRPVKLGFNLNNLPYLFVATFNLRGTHRRL
jgi:hypothetical protein